MRNTIKCFFVVNPCTTRIRFLFLQFSSIILLIISWSLQPYEPRLQPFCSSGKRSFCSRCEYVLSVRTDVRRLLVVKRQAIVYSFYRQIGRQFLRSFLSLLLASKYVVPSHIHVVAFSGFSIISFNNLVNIKWDNERAFNQKFGTLSIAGDFHFWDLVSAALSLSTVMFCHSCSFTF